MRPLHLALVDYAILGADWYEMKEAMRRWIVDEGPRLSFGFHDITDPGEVGFEFKARKDANAISPGVRSWRNPPSDRIELDEMVEDQLTRKIRKLAPYRESGYRTVLLLESNDIALTNSTSIISAESKAFGGVPPGVDEVWYADTTYPPEPIRFEEITEHLGPDGDEGAGP